MEKTTKVKGTFIIQDKMGRGTHFSKLIDFENIDLEVHKNVLRTLASGDSKSIDFEDIKEAKIVALIGSSKFRSILDGESFDSEFLLLWETDLSTITIQEINGTTNQVRVIVMGNTAAE